MKKSVANKPKLAFLFNLPALRNATNRSVFIDPANGLLHIKSAYTSDFYKQSYDAFVKPYQKAGLISKLRHLFNEFQARLYSTQPFFLRGIVAKMLTHVPTIYRAGNFLDVGCNTGYFISRLPTNWKSYGIEINHNAVRLSRQYKTIHVYQGVLEDFNFRQKFEFVRMSHVIEHITDYERFIAKTKRILNSGGCILIYTPNSHSISYQLFKKN